MSENRRENWEISGDTLREVESGQLMHSQIGPWVEANTVYVAQSEFERRALGTGELVIYDVGMGIAANALAAFSALSLLGCSRALRVISFEKYPEALRYALKSPDKFGFLGSFSERLEKLLEQGHWTSGEVPGPAYWDLLSGDFREVEMSGLPAADLVYFDFYAPASCPELWTVEIFSRLAAKLKPDGLLITYSSTKAVRAALLLAGFFVGQGASTSMKRETTVASLFLSALKNPLGPSWLAGFDRSPVCREEVGQVVHSHPQFSR